MMTHSQTARRARFVAPALAALLFIAACNDETTAPPPQSGELEINASSNTDFTYFSFSSRRRGDSRRSRHLDRLGSRLPPLLDPPQWRRCRAQGRHRVQPREQCRRHRRRDPRLYRRGAAPGLRRDRCVGHSVVRLHQRDAGTRPQQLVPSRRRPACSPTRPRCGSCAAPRAPVRAPMPSSGSRTS